MDDVKAIEIRVKHVEMLPDGRMDAENASIYTDRATKTMAIDRCNGTGPRFVKWGKIWYYKEDLDEWLAERRRVTSTAQDMTLNAKIKARERSGRRKKKIEEAEARGGT